MKINECLSAIDNKTDGKYDLLNLYESSELSVEQNIKLAEMLRINKPIEAIHKYLYEAINSDDESIIASNLAKDFIDYLKEKQLYIDELYYPGDNNLIIEIDNGDWKHEHLRFKHLVHDYFYNRGYDIDMATRVLDNTGSDTYSAQYSIIFEKKLDEKVKDDQETVELNYDDLKISEYIGTQHYSGNNLPDSGYDEPEYRDITISYTYEVPKQDIIENISENVLNDLISDEEYEANKDNISEYLDNFIEENFDEIFDKYENTILDIYRDQAREKAEEEQN